MRLKNRWIKKKKNIENNLSHLDWDNLIEKKNFNDMNKLGLTC
jgi:hypothetical protein